MNISLDYHYTVTNACSDAERHSNFPRAATEGDPNLNQKQK